MRLAIFTAGVQADNAGDSIIESAVLRLLGQEPAVRLPLTVPLSSADLDAVNGCGAAVIAGTNLYQSVFACNLTQEVLARIRVPVIPFGVGTSAPIGAVPRMNAEGVAAVRAIHRTCACSSVRDRASLRFLHSIGVKNVKLTGCPVLFHGLRLPDFSPSGEGVVLTPRARLLHIEPKWRARMLETMQWVATRYRPRLVLQSPYDLADAQPLADAHGLEIVMDAQWQAPAYIAAAQAQAMSINFRLHFAMLSMAYGKVAHVIAHDSRVSEFCDLMGLPTLSIQTYSDMELMLRAENRIFPADGFRRRWADLSREMAGFMQVNGLDSRLVPESVPAARPRRPAGPLRKPRVCMLADRPGWAFDNSAQAIARRLQRDLSCTVAHVVNKPLLAPADMDLLHVFFWGERYHQRFGIAPERVAKEVSSHRWEDEPAYGPCTPQTLVPRHLRDARTVVCTSWRLRELLKPVFAETVWTPNGIDPGLFRPPSQPRAGGLRIGWAGNAKDPVKGLRDILEPACEGRFDFRLAEGARPHADMAAFYQGIDVLALASRNEGEPLTLLEAMACGCFPVCVDIGIVPEVVRHEDNGFIVRERTPAAFRAAFDWCEAHLEQVRAAGARNAAWIARERNWDVCANAFRYAWLRAIRRAEAPRFRNDDVSADSDLAHFRAFCGVFHKYGLTQLHGVTLRGATNVRYRLGETPVEYEGHDTVAKLDNATIRVLSDDLRMEDRPDLIAYLASIPDEIALHGLYHTDYAAMSEAEQADDMQAGLDLLGRQLPNKPVRYFIAPFNRVGPGTEGVAARLGLTVLGAAGTHLESELPRTAFETGEWYRYHHHRFYPESTFTYYPLSIDKLDQALGRSFDSQPWDPDAVVAPQPKWRQVLDRLRRSMAGRETP